jgi:phage baseplate assembly protein W
MAIKIKNLKNISEQFIEKQYIYKDVTLDIGLNNKDSTGYLSSVPGKDIKVSYDQKAVVNSLLNLFNTRPGQRFLFPEYGMRLLKYVFVQITEHNGELIGDEILESIEKFEPRIKIENINVIADPDENQYTFDVKYYVPMLSTRVQTSFVLNAEAQTFVVIPNTNT